MASNPGRYVRSTWFITYNGSNGQAVADFMGGRVVVSDTGTLLRVAPPGYPYPFEFEFHVGDSYSLRSGYWSVDQFPQEYVSADALDRPDVVGTMDGVSVAVPILLLNASVDRVVTWNRPFTDTNYKVSFLNDVNTLGKITPVVKAGTKTTTGLTVTITAGLALTVAGVLHVLGTT